MRYQDFFEYYSVEELTTFTLLESLEDWQVSQSSAFKKGLKKHSSDRRVVDAYMDLLNFIKNYDRVPAIRDYPPEYNVHQIKQDKRFPNTLWAHLKGQKIGMLFSIDPGIINLIHIGTHQEVGWK